MKLRKDKKFQRQQEAVIRNEAWASLTWREQIQSLNGRRGNSLKQRSKILTRLKKVDADS